MSDDPRKFPSFEESGLDRETWLEADRLRLESALTSARSAARLARPEYYAPLVVAARKCGYAVAIHGSMARDFDVVAVPWVESPKTPRELAAAVAEAVGGIIKAESLDTPNKPHGRGGCIILALGSYIDLAIIFPRGAQ